MDKKISVIVPIYNVEKYLGKCLDSIINQTYTNLEIILVDDGSTDKSPEICDEYGIRDSRIKVVHKNNTGAGLSRNTGLELATGDYVVFADSDDYMKLNTYETLIHEIEEADAELVMGGAYFVDAKGNDLLPPNGNPFLSGKTLFEGDDIHNLLLNMLKLSDLSNEKSLYTIDMALWKGIFRRDIIERYGIRLVSERQFKSEDYIFYLEYMQYCKKIVLLKDYFYYHFCNSASLSRTYQITVQEQNNAMVKKMLDVISLYEQSAIYKNGIIKIYLEATYLVLLDIFRKSKNKHYREIIIDMKYVCEQECFQKYGKELDIFKNEKKQYVFLKNMVKKNYLLLLIIGKAYALIKGRRF